MRSAFIKALTIKAQSDPRVLLLTGDLGFKVFDDFRVKCPNQFLNMGVAESQMVSVAAGLALEGKKPFIYSITSFLTMRPYEQIRNDISFHKAAVCMVGVGGGFSYGPNGSSHHALTDVALMRALPEMNIFTPADAHEAAWAVEAAFEQSTPSYIRLGRAGEPNVHSGPLTDASDGIVLRQGNEIAVLVSGFILPNAIQAVDLLSRQGHSVRLISFPSIKPLAHELIAQAFEECSHVFTVEEHSVVGGFGSAVMELACAQQWDARKLCIVAVADSTVHEVGSHDYLRHQAALSTEQILRRMQQFIKGEVLC
jgi:transketolase